MSSARAAAVAVALVVAATSAGCSGGDDDQGRAGTPQGGRASTTTATTAEADAPTTLTGELPPVALPPGEVVTGRLFVPRTTFEVPTGWHGSQGRGSFAVGKGVDEAAQDFADVGVYVWAVPRPVAEVVAGFSGLEGLQLESTAETTVDGIAATAVEVAITGPRLVLEPIGLQADIPGGRAAVTFVEVDGTTLVISVHRWTSDAARAEAEAVVASFRFDAP